MERRDCATEREKTREGEKARHSYRRQCDNAFVEKAVRKINDSRWHDGNQVIVVVVVAIGEEREIFQP